MIAIVTSIHQPNSGLLMQFDKLYVLATGGRCIYDGPPKNLYSFLMSNNITIESNGYTPIEILLKIATTSSPNRNHQSGSSRYQCLKEEQLIMQLVSKNAENNEDKNKRYCEEYGRPLWYYRIAFKTFSCRHTIYLVQRMFHSFRRLQWRLYFSQTAFMLLTAVFTHFVYKAEIGSDPDCVLSTSYLESNATAKHMHLLKVIANPLDYVNKETNSILNSKSQFCAVSFLCFVSMACTIILFPGEVRLFKNEHLNRWYSTGSYFLAKMLTEIPMTIIISLAFAAIIYYGTNQPPELFRFGYYGLALTLGALNSIGLS